MSTEYKYLNPEHKLEIFRGSLKERFMVWKNSGKRRVAGPYHFRSEADSESFSFYLDSDFAPALNWVYCDETNEADIKHMGWYCDDFEQDTIRGIVLTLPNRRGYLAGWTMGEGMITIVERETISDLESACYNADSLAEEAAERSRNYCALSTAEQGYEEEKERIRELREEFSNLAKELRTFDKLPDSICKTISARLLSIRSEVKSAISTIAAHKDEIETYKMMIGES